MADRELCVEFQNLYLSTDGAGTWVGFDLGNWRTIDNSIRSNIWVSQVDIDLAGYNQQDLTLFFRNSFEQVGGSYQSTWTITPASGDTLNEFSSILSEWTIVSSVPLSDDNLRQLTIENTGFLASQPPVPLTGYDPGNFDRSMIIHGRMLRHALSPNIGSQAFTAPGTGLNLVADDQYFSSLEPTAADRLYCYRVVGTATPSIEDGTGLTAAYWPSKRILLTATSAKEEELDYMMRLKRSYELANQE